MSTFLVCCLLVSFDKFTKVGQPFKVIKLEISSYSLATRLPRFLCLCNVEGNPSLPGMSFLISRLHNMISIYDSVKMSLGKIPTRACDLSIGLMIKLGNSQLKCLIVWGMLHLAIVSNFLCF